MAVFSELYQDWDKLPPAGRVIVIAGVAGVAVLGYSAWRNRSKGSSTIGLPADNGSGSFTSSGSTGGTSTGPTSPTSPPPPVSVPSPTASPTPTVSVPTTITAAATPSAAPKAVTASVKAVSEKAAPRVAAPKAVSEKAAPRVAAPKAVSEKAAPRTPAPAPQHVLPLYQQLLAASHPTRRSAF